LREICEAEPRSPAWSLDDAEPDTCFVIKSKGYIVTASEPPGAETAVTKWQQHGKKR
jgi:hypothetical protein